MHRCEPPLFFLSFSTDTDTTERFAVFHLLSDRTVHLSPPTGISLMRNSSKSVIISEKIKAMSS